MTTEVTREQLTQLSDDQLQALPGDEFWDAIEPDGICPDCDDPRVVIEAFRRNDKATFGTLHTFLLRLTSEQFAHLQKYLAKIEKGKVKATWEQIGLVPASEGGVVRTCISPDGRPYRLAIAYNGDGDWAVVDPDSVPTEF